MAKPFAESFVISVYTHSVCGLERSYACGGPSRACFIVKSILIIRSTRVQSSTLRARWCWWFSDSRVPYVNCSLNFITAEIRRRKVYAICSISKGGGFNGLNKRKKKQQLTNASFSDNTLAVIATAAVLRFVIVSLCSPSFTFLRLFLSLLSSFVLFLFFFWTVFSRLRFNTLLYPVQWNFHSTCTYTRNFLWPFRACASFVSLSSCANTGLSIRLHFVLKVQLYIKDNVAFFAYSNLRRYNYIRILL